LQLPIVADEIISSSFESLQLKEYQKEERKNDPPHIQLLTIDSQVADGRGTGLIITARTL